MEAVDEQHVLVVDGRMRRLAAPKKKKLRHLILMHDISESIGEKWQTGAKVFDAHHLHHSLFCLVPIHALAQVASSCSAL